MLPKLSALFVVFETVSVWMVVDFCRGTTRPWGQRSGPGENHGARGRELPRGLSG